MHSMDTESATFHFNGGLADSELIIHPKDQNGNYIEFEKEIRIEANDILKLVALEYLQSEFISRIEQMDYKELLLKGIK